MSEHTHTPLVWYKFKGGEVFPAECYILVENRFFEPEVATSAAILLYGADKIVKAAKLGMRFMIIPQSNREQSDE